MRLIKDEYDLSDYEYVCHANNFGYRDGFEDLPKSYPYFLSISFGGESYNGLTTYNYRAFTLDDAWKLIWVNAEMKTQEGK